MRSRLLEFDGLKNTRDLGGMDARGGRTIKSCKLIRSGQLVGLSENDASKLSSLVGIVVDMRTDGEREAFPDSVLQGVAYLHNPIIGKLTPGVSREAKSVEQVIEALMFDPDGSLEYMCDLYRQFILSDFSVSSYSSFIRILLKGHDKAILWHCTAGKDRAGTSAVIVEKLLGVPDDDILLDYLDTNVNLRDEMNAVTVYVKRKSGSDSLLIDGAMKYLYGADQAYLDAFFSQIDERFGSFDAFVHDGLKLTDADLLRLEELYLN